MLDYHKYIFRNCKTSKQTFHISQTQFHRFLDYDTFNILESSNSAGTLALAPLVFYWNKNLRITKRIKALTILYKTTLLHHNHLTMLST